MAAGADLGENLTEGTLSMIIKLTLDFMVCEGLVTHLSEGIHGEN